MTDFLRPVDESTNEKSLHVTLTRIGFYVLGHPTWYLFATLQ